MLSQNQFLDSVVQIIKANGGERGIKGATLGQLIRTALPDQHWRDCGFPTLKDLLQELVKHKHVRIGDDDQGAFAVWLLAKQPAGSFAPTRQRYNPLRQDVWNAFAISYPSGRRFMHRTSGAVRMGQVERPTPAEQWAEFQAIGDEEQRRWAREFIAEIEGGNQFAAAVDDPDWFRRFPRELRLRDVDLGRKWNRVRTERVSAHVRHWCEENKIDPEVAFQQSATDSGLRNVSAALPREARTIVLAALARMTTDELMQIPIPAKYLLEEVSGGPLR